MNSCAQAEVLAFAPWPQFENEEIEAAAFMSLSQGKSTTGQAYKVGDSRRNTQSMLEGGMQLRLPTALWR